jgi:hypothetical protein
MFILTVVVSIWLQACAPQHYRQRFPAGPAPRPEPVPPIKVQPPIETRQPLEQSRIKEEDLKDRGSVETGGTKRAVEGQGRIAEAPPSPSEEGSLMAKITPQTSPHRAASLRLTEEGRRLVESGEYDKALHRLEKTISIDSTNPYGYYYLAQAHHGLTHYQESLNFLEVAESLFSGQSYWLAQVFALRGENYHALGMLQRADSNYHEALRWNPANRTATDGLARLRGESSSPR